MTTEQKLREALADTVGFIRAVFGPKYDGDAAVANARAALALEPSEDRYRWRPISEMHEDYGPCAVIDIRDAGGVAIAHVCDIDFDPDGWTHFSRIAPLTNEQAGEMIAALDVAEAPAVTPESPQSECAALIGRTFDKMIDAAPCETMCRFAGVTSEPCSLCGKSWMSPDHQAPMFDPMTPR